MGFEDDTCNQEAHDLSVMLTLLLCSFSRESFFNTAHKSGGGGGGYVLAEKMFAFVLHHLRRLTKKHLTFVTLVSFLLYCTVLLRS
jgi:hypothetical protein